MTYPDSCHANRSQRSPVGMAAFFLILLYLTFDSCAWARDPAPVIEVTGQSGNPGSIEQRLQVIERRLDNQGMADVLNRLANLQQQIQQVVGNMEVQAHDIDSMKKRQRDLYLDIDRRLQQVEKELDDLKAAQQHGGAVAQSPDASGTMSGAPIAGGGSATASPAGSAVDRQLDREAYQRAFNLLKQGRYSLAIASFKAFLETYPKAEYADNAQYWMGEAYYVQKHYKEAIAEYQKVLDQYPKSNKRPDALLKMGFTYELMNDLPKAKLMLNKVIKDYPDSSVAQLASKRLQDMKTTH